MKHQTIEYKSAPDLKITEAEHRGLIAFVKDAQDDKLEAPGKTAISFSMNVCCASQTSCGTVCCIKGHIMLTGNAYQMNMSHSASLAPLFAPKGWDAYDDNPYAKAPLGCAKLCVEHFLQTGRVDWPMALSVFGL